MICRVARFSVVLWMCLSLQENTSHPPFPLTFRVSRLFRVVHLLLCTRARPSLFPCTKHALRLSPGYASLSCHSSLQPRYEFMSSDDRLVLLTLFASSLDLTNIIIIPLLVTFHL